MRPAPRAPVSGRCVYFEHYRPDLGLHLFKERHCAETALLHEQLLVTYFRLISRWPVKSFAASIAHVAEHHLLIRKIIHIASKPHEGSQRVQAEFDHVQLDIRLKRQSFSLGLFERSSRFQILSHSCFEFRLRPKKRSASDSASTFAPAGGVKINTAKAMITNFVIAGIHFRVMRPTSTPSRPLLANGAPLVLPGVWIQHLSRFATRGTDWRNHRCRHRRDGWRNDLTGVHFCSSTGQSPLCRQAELGKKE